MRGSTGLSRAGATALFVYQLVVFALVRAAVVYAFRDNPGDTVEMHLFDHNQYVLLNPGEMSKRLPLLIAVPRSSERGAGATSRCFCARRSRFSHPPLL